MKKSDRLAVYNKYNGHCAYCGCELNEKFHVDHLEPVKRIVEYSHDKKDYVKTGKVEYPERNCLDNYMPACASCNILKHAAPLESFRVYISKLLTIINRDNNNYRVAKRYGQIQEVIEPVVFYFEKSL